MEKDPKTQENKSQVNKEQVNLNSKNSGGKSDKHSNKAYAFFMPVNYPTRKKQIITSMALFLALFLGIFVYITVSYAKNKTSFIDNSYNRQEANLLKQNLRGKILTSEGEVLAYSEVNEYGDQVRVYPYGSLFAHAVGYSCLSKSAIEASQNYYLLQSQDSTLDKASNLSQGQLNECYNVVSTLNLKLQKTAGELLGDRNGAVIMTDVKTGKILVLVSHPDFDPNTLEEDWIDIIANKSSSALLNRVTNGLYPPGSVFKVFTAGEYYSEDLDYDGYSFNCPGYFEKDGNKIVCYHRTSHGSVDFKSSFAKSCNSSFANIGMSLSDASFTAGLNRLLFNEKLPSIEKRNEPSVSSFDISTEYKKMQTSIGQGDTLVSPYHINLITMAIANDGVIMNPYIVDSVCNDEGKIVKAYAPSEYRKVYTKEEADFLTDLMMAVVEDGTASALKNDKYTIAGKTGSAEYNDFGDSHGWFTCFAPAEDPEVAITVIVEKGGTGSSSAAPLAKSVLDVYFGMKDN